MLGLGFQMTTSIIMLTLVHILLESFDITIAATISTVMFNTLTSLY